MRVLITIVLHLVCLLRMFGQTEENKKFSIRGVVTDEKGKPIPYSSVLLFNNPDSAQVSATASDDKGKFDLSADAGSYFLKISFLSYEEEIVSGIIITGKDVDLAPIVLKTSIKVLNEVVVTAEKKLMELKLDKKVYNVSQDVSNIGANASEILENIPSVTVDVDGNVSLRGSQGVRILVDGKPSALTGIRSTDALRNLQGAMIDKIEVITNPSSRFDAAGETGIINIILKKNKTTGFNGNFTSTVGYPSNFSGAYSVNYRTQKMNLFSSFGTNYRKNKGKGFSTQRYTGFDTSFVYNRSNSRARSGRSFELMAGIDYFIDKNTTLTGSLLIDAGKENNINNIFYEDLNSTGQITKSIKRIDDEKENERDTEASLSLRKKYPGKNDKEWTVDFKWTNSGETESSDYIQDNINGGERLIQRSANPAYEDNILLQTDYISSFGEEGNFETGIKGTIRKIRNEYLVEEQTNGGAWIKLPAFDNNMEFTERVYAFYGMIGNKIRKFSYQVGLRGEYTDMTTGLIKTNEVNDRSYFNVFPSGSFSYELSDINTLQLSYSYRINRPNFRNLTPFADFSDPRVFFVGNPNLDPEFTHSIEAGNLTDWGKGSFLAGVYYRYKKGVIERIRILDTLSGITNIIPVNLSTQNDLGLEFNFNLTAYEWWKLSSSFNFFSSHAKGEYDDELLESKTVSWTNRTTSRVTFFKQLDFQASLNYQSPRKNTQGKDLSSYSIDLGLAKDVFKAKGTLTLNVRDLMNSRRRRSIVDIPGYFSSSDYQWRPRQINLTLNFRLNQQKVQRDDDEEREDGGNEN